MNVVDAALVEADGVTTPKNTVTALVVLAAEVRRFRAGVEKLADKHQTYHHLYGDSVWVKLDDVLAALGVTDG